MNEIQTLIQKLEKKGWTLAAVADKLGTKWFTVDYNYASSVLQDVVKNYKQYLTKSRKQTQYVKDNFSLQKMGELFCNIVDKGLKEVPQQVALKLPKLKKVGSNEPPKLKLPKLKKVNV